jgi:hypothetical protein
MRKSSNSSDLFPNLKKWINEHQDQPAARPAPPRTPLQKPRQPAARPGEARSPATVPMPAALTGCPVLDPAAYGLGVKIVVVDSETADRFLSYMPFNRKHRIPWICTLSQLILGGDFHLTHQGIAFNRRGELVDGQNRLKAIIASNVPTELMVVWGLSDEAVEALDLGAKRTMVDTMGALGVGDDINRNMTAISIAMNELGVVYPIAPTNSERLRFLYRHREAITFASELPRRQRFCLSPIRGVIARAWYTADKDELARFNLLLNSGGPYDNHDSAAVALRNAIVTPSNPKAKAKNFIDIAGRRELYWRTQRALRAFLDHEPLARIYEASQEYFPIPSEDE